MFTSDWCVLAIELGEIMMLEAVTVSSTKMGLLGGTAVTAWLDVLFSLFLWQGHPFRWESESKHSLLILTACWNLFSRRKRCSSSKLQVYDVPIQYATYCPINVRVMTQLPNAYSITECYYVHTLIQLTEMDMLYIYLRAFNDWKLISHLSHCKGWILVYFTYLDRDEAGISLASWVHSRPLELLLVV